MFVASPDASSANLAFLSTLPLRAEWKNLGTLLEIPQHKLKEIQAKHAGLPNQMLDCLTSTFEYWLNNCESTCELLIQAVNAIGEQRDAVKMLCEKYGELIAYTTSDF